MAHRCEIKEWSTCCPIYKFFTLISKKWNIFILKLIGEGHDTFTSLKAWLNELNSSILTQRLDELEYAPCIPHSIVQGGAGHGSTEEENLKRKTE